MVFPAVSQSNQRLTSVWDTSFDRLTLEQEGPFVWGVYNYHGGKVIGAVLGGKLYGFWWEDDDTASVGPEGKWCGPFVLSFDPAVTQFTGTYGKSSRGESTFWKMDPSRMWTGKKITGSFDPFVQ